MTDPLERGIMTSAGVGARVNVFGIMVVEIDYVNGFARDRGWQIEVERHRAQGASASFLGAGE